MGLGQGERGYAMAALLVSMTVMAVLMSAAMPVWTHFSKREKEEELIWRGQQYARAIGLFQRKFANTFPPNVDVLVEQKFLRKKYKDPVTGEDFQVIPATGAASGSVPGMSIVPGGPVAGGSMPGGATQGGRQTTVAIAPPPRPAGQMTSVGTTVQAGVGIQGVVSKSTATSIKIFNGRTKHNEWAFVYMVTAQRIQGGQQPGAGPAGQQLPGPPGQQRPGGTSPFTPMPGTGRRPGISQPPGAPGGAGGTGGGQRPPSPFSTRPTGQPPSRPPGS